MLNFTGKTRIFKNEKGFYSTTISKKEKDSQIYKKMYISVNFKKGVEIENESDISIINGFLSFNEWTDKDGKVQRNPVLVVLEYELNSNNNINNQDLSDFTDDKPF
jgi:hypothetical protein